MCYFLYAKMNQLLLKIRRFFFTYLLIAIKALTIAKEPLKRIFILIFKPFFWLIKILIRSFILPLYQLLRKAKKGILLLPFLVKLKLSEAFWHNGPWVILILICSVIFASNLRAEVVKPENYGQRSLLYKIIQTNDQFFLNFDENYLEEFTEGPLNPNQGPSSYLQNEAITQESAETPINDEGIDTLISVTGDTAAIISPSITDPSLINKQRDKIIEYQVQSGDTLSTIAAKYNLKTATLLWENNLSYYSYIKPGQVLKILPVDGLSYKIKAGDSLSKIAKLYKTDEEKIIEFNKLASAADIKTGQEIILPGAVKPQIYTPPQSYSIKNIFSAPAAPSGSKLQWPTNSYRITQYFNWRHTGVDIGNKIGQPIYAAESGVVKSAGWNRSGYGYMIMIDHGGGLITLYAHASKLYVKAGDKISRGQVIAAIGSTGRSTGPHLHFETRINNSRVNPLGYIR